MSVPALTIELPLFMVTVPAEAIRLPLLPTDKAWAMVKFDAVVTAAEVSIVKL